jgi:hypothetical protein
MTEDDLYGSLPRADVHTCMACRKESDAAKAVYVRGEAIWLCGTHFDTWVQYRLKDTHPDFATTFLTWLYGMRTTYKACWTAEIGDAS